MKKIFTIIIIVVALAIIGVVIFTFASKSPSNSAAPGGNGGGQAQGQQGAGQLSKVYRIPTSTTIMLNTLQGSVTMDNFYKTALGADEEFIVMAQNQTYEMTYDVNTNAFYLYIAQAPFDANRAQTEAAFTALLGVSNTDACKLNVEEGFAPGSPYGSGQLKLSFCGGGAFQAK